MVDEAPIAGARADANSVLGYGERGFGIDLDPVAALVRDGRRCSRRSRSAGRVGVYSELRVLTAGSPPSSPAPSSTRARPCTGSG